MSLASYVDDLSDTAKKTFAFFSLMAIQISLLLVVTLSKANHQSYTYNPASAICMAEACKLAISAGTYFRTGGTVEEAKKTFVNKEVLTAYVVLALIYCINNQLTFTALALTQPGNVALLKSTTPFLTAILQWFVNNAYMMNLEWISIIFLSCGLTLTQWNDCTSGLRISSAALGVLAFSSCLTAVSSVGNAYMVKKIKDTPVLLQNMVLYSFGVLFNLQAYFFATNGFIYGNNGAGFFEGYDNIFAIIVVILNGLIGVAITFVYKYGDAVIKCFAQVLSSIVLVIISAMFFGSEMTVSSTCGAIVVFAASYTYLLVVPDLKKALGIGATGKSKSANASDSNSIEMEEKKPFVDSK